MGTAPLLEPVLEVLALELVPVLDADPLLAGELATSSAYRGSIRTYHLPQEQRCRQLLQRWS